MVAISEMEHIRLEGRGSGVDSSCSIAARHSSLFFGSVGPAFLIFLASTPNGKGAGRDVLWWLQCPRLQSLYHPTEIGATKTELLPVEAPSPMVVRLFFFVV